MEEHVTLPGGIEPLWGMKELTHYLGCSDDVARRLIRERGLPYTQYGSNTSPLHFRPEQVRQWVIENELKPAGQTA